MSDMSFSFLIIQLTSLLFLSFGNHRIQLNTHLFANKPFSQPKDNVPHSKLFSPREWNKSNWMLEIISGGFQGGGGIGARVPFEFLL